MAYHVPPDPNILEQQDVRILKIKQPWAGLFSIKDVENRDAGFRFMPKSGFPVWAMIATSQKTPSKQDMEKARSILHPLQGDQGVYLSLYNYVNPLKQNEGATPFSKGEIVGMVKIIGYYEPHELPWDTPWHEPGKKGLMISDAWYFDEPVALTERDTGRHGFQLGVSLAERPEYKAPLALQISKLAPGYR